MTVKFFRFIRGYVDFKVSGRFPERLLNLTSRYGVGMWGATPCDGGLSASMYLSDYKRIRFFAKKARLRTRVVGRHGLPFIIAKYKGRVGLPLGLLFGITAIMLLSQFVWSIEICGTQTISDTNLLGVLEDNGIETGVPKKSFDVQSVQRAVMSDVAQISWMSINITGSKMTVEIKEKAEKPQIDDSKSPCNVTARTDGVITKINASDGTTKVKKGSGVAKGELLVSGIVETKRDTLLYLHAQAEVFADVKLQKSMLLAKKHSYQSLGRKSNSKLRAKIFWLDFPCSISFSGFSSSLATESTNNLMMNNTPLPVGITTLTEYEITESCVSADKAKAEKYFKNELLLYEAFEKGKSSLKSKKVSITESSDSYSCTCEYIFNENIAQTVEFSVTD